MASALSLTIGLEMLIYLALGGVATVLMWIDDRDQRRRLAAYAVTLAGGTALGFLGFASYANRLAVCDALSPVWLSDALVGGALMLGLAMLSPQRDCECGSRWRPARALLIAGFHALVWPHCLSRLEGVSPEVYRVWLSHVREARPVYRHGWQVATLIVALPLTARVRLGAAGLARARRIATCCAGRWASPLRRWSPGSCCCGRRGPAPRRR